MRYTKEDVEFHSEGFGYSEGLPAVNVKTEPWRWEEFIGAAREEDSGLDPRFEEWYRAKGEASEDTGYPSFLDSYWEFACESGWELLQSDAEFFFGDGVKVESQGRSGGWAVVRGLDDFESWDAIMLSKWYRFQKTAREIADYVPASMAQLASINGFEAWLATQPSLLTIELVTEGAGL